MNCYRIEYSFYREDGTKGFSAMFFHALSTQEAVDAFREKKALHNYTVEMVFCFKGDWK